MCICIYKGQRFYLVVILQEPALTMRVDKAHIMSISRTTLMIYHCIQPIIQLLILQKHRHRVTNMINQHHQCNI